MPGQPLVESVVLESVQCSCLSSPCTYQFHLFCHSGFCLVSLPRWPSGHIEDLEESIPDMEVSDRASLAGSVQIVFGAWCEAGVRCKE